VMRNLRKKNGGMKAKSPSKLRVRDGAQRNVIGGTHAGKSGTVRDIKTGYVSITVVQPTERDSKPLPRTLLVRRSLTKDAPANRNAILPATCLNRSRLVQRRPVEGLLYGRLGADDEQPLLGAACRAARFSARIQVPRR
jgi:hypothetical protein